MLKTNNPIILSDINACVDNVIQKTGKKIILGIPLGLGKPNQFVNAIYQKAKKDTSLHLTILSALTLEKPKGKNLLEKRFIEPFAERIFEDYPDLDYEIDRTTGKLPSNIRVIEFYFPAGKFINNPLAQQNYVSSNYTHVARDLIDRGVNVIAQMITLSPDHKRASLSCNADVTTDILSSVSRDSILFIGQVNNNLPFMHGDADLPVSSFDYILQNTALDFKLFGPPKLSISDTDYMIGLHASTLVQDDGELQIGIGSMGDSLIYALCMRHERNDQYRTIIKEFEIEKKFGKEVSDIGDLSLFKTGLFGATEMLVDSLMYLVDSGIMKKKVYNHVILQRLLNKGLILEDKITPDSLYQLLASGAIQPKLTSENFKFLQQFGIFKKKLTYKYGNIYFEDQSFIEADLNQDQFNEAIVKRCLGNRLINGAIIHAGFFLGPTQFYDWLRKLPDWKRSLIHMKSVRKINQLYGHEEIDRLHRKNARFVNTCLMMTLSGAAVSDGLEDGRVISGVGGQYNFVEMAQALPDGRSILQLRSTRSIAGSDPVSNIVYNYGHVTIPRHLRDMVVTEYGIADLRGKTDEEIIVALIKIADSRFQGLLISQAKSSGKLSSSYVLPEAYKNNTPDQIRRKLAGFKEDNLFPAFPFGTDFTIEEQILGQALKSLKNRMGNKTSKISTLIRSILSRKIPADILPYLKRMKLDNPNNFTEKLYQKLLIHELKRLL